MTQVSSRESITPSLVHNAVKANYCVIFWMKTTEVLGRKEAQTVVKKQVKPKPNSDYPSRLCICPKILLPKLSSFLNWS